MKKVILIAALAIVSFANAQKGSFLLMGSVGFSSSKDSQGTAPAPSTDTETKVNNFNFSPKFGYQFSDHMTVGIEGSISSTKTENNTSAPLTPNTTTKGNGFTVGPFLRYTKSLSDIFSVYADLGVGFQAGKATNESTLGILTTSTETKADGFYAGITPALFINMKKGFGINIGIGGLGYSTLKFDDNVDAFGAGTIDHDSNNFEFTFGQTFNIGISKNF